VSENPAYPEHCGAGSMGSRISQGRTIALIEVPWTPSSKSSDLKAGNNEQPRIEKAWPNKRPQKFQKTTGNFGHGRIITLW
jgi:hypothetical protein